MESTTLSGPSKRAKANGDISQVAQCLVDGCNSDLRQCREYHRRHKVCELHSKTPKVMINGREQRFCQQCSRFHALIEFDEEKRSCRKRLDGHNRRRRKPQPDCLSRNSGLLFSSQRGARLLSFGSPETFTSSIASPTWASVSDNNMLTYGNQADRNYIVRQNSFSDCSSHGYKGVNQFQLLLSTESALPEASMGQLLAHPNSAPASSNCAAKMFSDGLSEVVDSDRALSLLSSAPGATREIGLSNMVQPESIHHTMSLGDDLQFSSIGQYHPFSQDIESKPVVSVTDSQVSDSSNLHFQDMFQNAPDGSRTLSFKWE